MNPVTFKDAERLFSSVAKSLLRIKKAGIVVCPPFVYLANLKKLSRKIELGAQDAFYEEAGAYTGEISSAMLYDLGARYVILGHSERRALGEGNMEVNRKVKRALNAGLVPIVCVGEKERDEKHNYLHFVKTQIETALAGVSKNFISKIIIAYEPVWAIGKNAMREATAEEFLEMSIFIQKTLSDKFGVGNVSKTRILYGGSVNPKNSADFLKTGEADGFLVGRDSLDAKKFVEIIKICEALKG